MASPNLRNGLQFSDWSATESNNGMFDDGSGYGFNSASDMSNSWFDNLLDPTGFVKGFYNDMMGFTSQEREFEQQMKMTQYENWWNSAAQQMNRAKEAGINPLTAAGGIAGNGNGSVASAGGSASPSSAPFDVVSGIGAMSTSAHGQGALSDMYSASARNADRLADAEILRSAGAFAQALTASGTPEIAAMELGLKFVRSGLNGFSAAFNADSLCRRFDLENDAIDAEINAENMRFDNLQKQGLLYLSEADKLKAETLHQNIINQIDSKRRDLVLKYNELALQGDFAQEFAFVRRYGVDSPEVQQYYDFLKGKFYNTSLGQFTADKDTIWERMKLSAQGHGTGELVNAPAMAKLENYKTLFSALSDLYFSSNGSLEGLAHRIVSLIGAEVGISTEDLESMLKDAFDSVRP